MSMPRGARTMLLTALAALLLGAAAPASALAASAADEYTLDIPGVRDTPGSQSGTTSVSGDSSQHEQTGVVGEQDAATSPLSDALGSPLQVALLAVAVATVGCCVLIGVGQLRTHKQ